MEWLYFKVGINFATPLIVLCSAVPPFFPSHFKQYSNGVYVHIHWVHSLWTFTSVVIRHCLQTNYQICTLAFISEIGYTSDGIMLLANLFLRFKRIGVHPFCIVEHHVVLQRLTAAACKKWKARSVQTVHWQIRVSGTSLSWQPAIAEIYRTDTSKKSQLSFRSLQYLHNLE